MLALRKRGRGGLEAANLGTGALSWGFNAQASLGIGVSGRTFPWARGVAGLANVVQVCPGAGRMLLKSDAGVTSVWSVGYNGYGAQGQGTKGDETAGEESTIVDWTQVTGGIPIYREEHFHSKKTGLDFTQPLGPVGPLITGAIAIATGANQRYVLMPGGRVLCWGQSTAGCLSNGYTLAGNDPQGNWETGEWRPQYAPWWMQTEGPAQGETGGAAGALGLDTASKGNGTGANILTGVLMMAGAKECAIFVLSGNRIFVTGDPAGWPGPFHYITEDAKWAEHVAAGGLKGANIEAITSGSSQYTVLLSDGTLRVVGVNREEGMFGIGIEGGVTNVRTVHTPLKPGSSEPLGSDVPIIAISQGQYHIKALDAHGRLFTWGSNGGIDSNGLPRPEGQQGLGTPYEKNEPRPVQIASLGDSTSKPLDYVTAVYAGGSNEERGGGARGSDTCIALLADKTVRTWGTGQLPPEAHVQGTGAMGDGTYESHTTPRNPGVKDIIGVMAAGGSMTVIQRPGHAGVHPVVVTSPGSKLLVVNWTPLTIPGLRPADNWEVTVQRVEVNPATGKREAVHSSGLLGPNATSWSFVLPFGWAGASNEVELKVIEKFTQYKPVPIGGKIQTVGLSNQLLVEWAQAGEPEKAWFVEWRRTGKNAKGARENYWRSAELPGSARSYLLTLLPSPKEVPGNEIEIEVYGAHEGTFKTATLFPILTP